MKSKKCFVDTETKLSHQYDETTRNQVDVIIVNGKTTYISSVPPMFQSEETKRLVNM